MDHKFKRVRPRPFTTRRARARGRRRPRHAFPRRSLQVAENKRLQGHIGELKKENKHLYSQVVALQSRVKMLEEEIVGD